jgi:hypothetical protein
MAGPEGVRGDDPSGGLYGLFGTFTHFCMKQVFALIDKRNLSTSYIRSSEILFELEGNCFMLVA